MKPLSEHAPNCNCDQCSMECGEGSKRAALRGENVSPTHTCKRNAPHKGKHRCCCGEEWKK